MMYNFLLFQKREGRSCVIFPNFQSLFPPLDLFLLTFPLCIFLKIYFSLISFSFKLLFSFPYLTSFLLFFLLKIHLRIKRLESKLRRKYVLNLFDEPRHLAKIKTPKFLKFPSKGVTDLRERKLKKKTTKNPREKTKSARKYPRQLSNVKVSVL